MPKKTRTTKSYLIFLSHSTKDRWIARQIARVIEDEGRKDGVKIFLDEKDIEGGESIPDSIRKNIQECNEFLVFLSQYSIDRPWVLIEIGAAWGLEKRIVAIIDKVSPEEMPEVIAPYKAIDLNNLDEYLKQLINRAKEAEKQI